MGYRDRPLDNPINWSFRAGRLFGIDIRVHVVFVLCAVVMVWMEIPDRDSGTSWSLGRVVVDALGTYAVLFTIVLLHEFGHCFGARHTGGEADEILMWPLGGLAFVNPPHKARAHMITTIGGPMVNVLICVLCAILLILWMGSLGAVPWNPIHPFFPTDRTIFPTTGQLWLLRVYGLSYFLLLVNLLPIFPFDGGRIVQAWLWPRKGYVRSMEIATGTGMAGAIIIGLIALFLEESWLLLMIAVFGYITCWQNRRILREHGELAGGIIESQYSDGYQFFGDQQDQAERTPGIFERRRQRRAARKTQQQQKREKERQRAVEAALRKVSISGIESLTSQERQILEEETKRKQSTK